MKTRQNQKVVDKAEMEISVKLFLRTFSFQNFSVYWSYYSY